MDSTPRSIPLPPSSISRVRLLFGVILLAFGLPLVCSVGWSLSINGGPHFWPVVDQLAVTTPLCGQWRATADLRPGTPGGLTSIAALSPQDLWAVGDSTVWHGDGQHWDTLALPSPVGATYFSLTSIAAIAHDDIWTIGYTSPDDQHGPATPLAWHWNGKHWTMTAFPLLNTSDATPLTAIAGTTADRVWAVGNGGLILYWDGVRWVQQELNVAQAGSIVFTSVVALSGTDAWAVGYVHEASGAWWGVTAHWDGQIWHEIPQPADRMSGVLLQAVTATSPQDVWVVGTRSAAPVNEETFTMHWDGATWQVVPSPNVSTQNYLYGVVVISAHDVWAVGDVGSLWSEGKMLVLHWDGQVWSVVPTPRPMNDQNLRAVAGPGTQDVWAVGGAQYSEDGTYYSLAAHFAATTCPK